MGGGGGGGQVNANRLHYLLSLILVDSSEGGWGVGGGGR